jgi:hypothetical protein
VAAPARGRNVLIVHFHLEPILLARGFNKELLDGLIRDGLATRNTARAGRQWPIEVARIKITEAGRATLAR